MNMFDSIEDLYHFVAEQAALKFGLVCTLSEGKVKLTRAGCPESGYLQFRMTKTGKIYAKNELTSYQIRTTHQLIETIQWNYGFMNAIWNGLMARAREEQC